MRTWLSSPWRLGVTTWLGLFLMMLAWALASPVSAGPDESGHIMKAAATVRGDWTGIESPLPGNGRFVLPGNVGDVGGELTCYVGQLNASAACAPALESRGSEPTAVDTGAAAYNPVYYAVVGWPSLIVDGTAMVILMRAVNALLVSALWALAVVTLTLRRPGRMAFLAVATTPLAVYLGGIVNPSGVETAATAAAVGLALAVVNTRSRSLLLPVLVGIVGALLLNLRSISPLFLALAVIFVALLCGVRRTLRAFLTRRYLIVIAVLAVIGAAALAWIVLISSPAGFIPSSDVRRPGRAEAFFYSLSLLDNQFKEMTGILGWFDAPLPEPVYLAWFAAFAALVVGTLVIGARRRVRVVVLAVAVAVAIPALLQAATAHEMGYIWQGRYSLPLLVLVLCVAALALPRGEWRRVATWRGSVVVVVLLALHVWCFAFVMKRYVAGVDAPWSALWAAEAWSPPGGPFAVFVCFVVGGTVVAATTVARSLPSRAVRMTARDVLPKVQDARPY